MGEKIRDTEPVIKGDRLLLDFGKKILRPGQSVEPSDLARKLPPIPGRVDPEKHVPEDQVLNRTDKKRDEE